MSPDVDIDVGSWAVAISEWQSRLAELSQFVSLIANVQNNVFQD
jgi:hypothetical protein